MTPRLDDTPEYGLHGYQLHVDMHSGGIFYLCSTFRNLFTKKGDTKLGFCFSTKLKGWRGQGASFSMGVENCPPNWSLTIHWHCILPDPCALWDLWNPSARSKLLSSGCFLHHPPSLCLLDLLRSPLLLLSLLLCPTTPLPRCLPSLSREFGDFGHRASAAPVCLGWESTAQPSTFHSSVYGHQSWGRDWRGVSQGKERPSLLCLILYSWRHFSVSYRLEVWCKNLHRFKFKFRDFSACSFYYEFSHECWPDGLPVDGYLCPLLLAIGKWWFPSSVIPSTSNS